MRGVCHTERSDGDAETARIRKQCFSSDRHDGLKGAASDLIEAPADGCRPEAPGVLGGQAAASSEQG